MDLDKVKLNVTTALETAYCYYNLHHECDKGLTMPSRTDCKACMIEAFDNIVRSDSTK